MISHISEDTALIFIKSSLSVPWRRELHFQFWDLIPKKLFYGLKIRFLQWQWRSRDEEMMYLQVAGVQGDGGGLWRSGPALPTTRSTTALGRWGPLAPTGGVVAGSGRVKVWSTQWDPVLKKLIQMTASQPRPRSSNHLKEMSFIVTLFVNIVFWMKKLRDVFFHLERSLNSLSKTFPRQFFFPFRVNFLTDRFINNKTVYRGDSMSIFLSVILSWMALDLLKLSKPQLNTTLTVVGFNMNMTYYSITTTTEEL